MRSPIPPDGAPPERASSGSRIALTAAPAPSFILTPGLAAAPASGGSLIRGTEVEAAALALSFILTPGLAAAQASGESLIRDTEIEETLHKDADPIFAAAGIDPKSVQVILIGSKELNAFAAPKVMAVFTGLILQTKN